MRDVRAASRLAFGLSPWILVDLGLCNDPECYRELTVKSQVWKRYSPKALQRLSEALDEGLDINRTSSTVRLRTRRPSFHQAYRGRDWFASPAM